MNNEPVGHLYPEGEGVTVYDIKFAWKVTGTTEPIPLYTHPAKTLTISDRDILKIVHDKFTKFGFEADYIVEDTELIEFAKAILRKAQEK